jgi:insulysin
MKFILLANIFTLASLLAVQQPSNVCVSAFHPSFLSTASFTLNAFSAATKSTSNSKLFSTADSTTEISASTTSDATTDNDANTNAESTESSSATATATVSTQSSNKSSKSKIITNNEDFLKPSLDNREYRSITLPNNLQVLLVSDSKTDVEAAAVHIKAGHFDDPEHRPGLAHFHEHMIFLGNNKYPGENDFDKFVSKNGGSTNAYTDMEDTNYYFSVAPMGNHDDEIDDDDDEEEEGDIDDSVDEEVKENSKVSLALSGALDRFAQFFISPSFNEDSVERELRAIDSEYLNGMTSDSWRGYQLLKYTCDQRHPFSKFGCGNYNTLTNGGTMSKSTEGDDNGDGDSNGDVILSDAVSSGGSNPRDDLLKFWEEKYVAKNMKLCVVGKASLDELQRTVEESFADVRPGLDVTVSNNEDVIAEDADSNSENIFKTENSKYGIPAFGPKQTGFIREYIPVVETRLMRLTFAVPPSEDPLVKEHRPDRVLSHLIGHESPGSLHALLCEEGLINDLASGAGVNTEDFSLFTLTLELTPKGMAQRDRVISLVWKWINLIRTAVDENPTLMEKYHDELCLISQTHFRFRENGDPTDFCSHAAELLFDYDPAQLLAGSALPGPYNEKVVKAFIDRLNPDNVIVSIHSPDLEKETVDNIEHECNAASSPWETEKWYRAKYRDAKIPDNLKEEWSNVSDPDDRLFLPAFNDFLPTDFSLRAEDAESVASADPDIDYGKELPKLVVDRPGLQMWHKMDRTFKVPRTSMSMLITTPNTYRSPRTMTLNRLFVKVLEDDLNSYIYDASLAGCRARVTCLPSGYSISVNGYSEKLPLLLDVVTRRMLSITEEMKEGAKARPGLAAKFEKATKNLLKDTKNFKFDSPYETASYISRMLLESNVRTLFDYVSFSLLLRNS